MTDSIMSEYRILRKLDSKIYSKTFENIQNRSSVITLSEQINRKVNTRSFTIVNAIEFNLKNEKNQ